MNKGTFLKSQPGCQMIDCPHPDPNICIRCGFACDIHAQRVDTIHKQGLRMDNETGLRYLPVMPRQQALDA